MEAFIFGTVFGLVLAAWLFAIREHCLLNRQWVQALRESRDIVILKPNESDWDIDL